MTLAAPAARAQAPATGAFDLIASGLLDIPAWWAEPGRPGMTDQAWLGTAMPWTLAGLAAGAWALELPDRVEGAPFPGVLGIGPMLGAFDSVTTIAGAGGAVAGFEGSLATAASIPALPHERRTLGYVQLGGGDFGFDENALAVERGDSLHDLRVEVIGGHPGRTGSLERAGHHLWQVGGRWSRGPHQLAAGFGNRGTAMSVAGGEEQSTGGDAGHVRYRYASGATSVSAGYERAYDHHESFGGLRNPSRRDAQVTRGALDAAWSGGRLELGARAAAAESEVHRQGEDAFATRARWVWGTAWAGLKLGPGRAQAALGAGHHDVLGGVETAPSFEYRVASGRWQARVGVERVLWAVWSDLEPASLDGPPQAPFLQSTWAGVAELRHSGPGRVLHGTLLAGRTRDRALVTREPIEDLWLRDGFHADPDRYDFALGMLDATWHGRHWGSWAEGFGLGRSTSGQQVDPAWGGRGEVEYRTQFFGGDLVVRLRAGVEAVGARTSEGLEARTLPAYATSIVGVVAMLADAVITLRVRNLENRVREETWLDTATFSEALGSGREMRLLVTVRLSN